VNFLRRLALQEKKLDDSSRLDFVEIARVPDMLPRLFPSWSDQGLISTPVLVFISYCHFKYVGELFKNPVKQVCTVQDIECRRYLECITAKEKKGCTLPLPQMLISSSHRVVAECGLKENI